MPTVDQKLSRQWRLQEVSAQTETPYVSAAWGGLANSVLTVDQKLSLLTKAGHRRLNGDVRGRAEGQLVLGRDDMIGTHMTSCEDAGLLDLGGLVELITL